MTKDVIYVDEDDNEIGHGSIGHATENGIARRIARVILSNDQDEILLQRRGNVILFPYAWNDSVSGHVDVGEAYLEAALREMEEEMGISGVELSPLDKFYEVEENLGKVLKAFSTVFVGTFNGIPKIDQHEVSDFKWIQRDELKKWMQEKPDDFTPGAIKAFQSFFKNT